MPIDLEDGTEKHGHVEGLTDEDHPAMLRLDGRGAVLTVPRRGPREELLATVFAPWDHAREPLRFTDTQGAYLLSNCQLASGIVALPGDTALSRLRVARIVEAGGHEADYAEVDGMESEVAGLAAWCGVTTVTQSVEPQAINLRVENPEPIQLSCGMSIESSFHFTPRPVDDVFRITDKARLRTTSSSPRPWTEHATQHRMIQDLMCLVYGRPCRTRLLAVKREDDQPALLEGRARRQWQRVYEPTFGRMTDGGEALDRRLEEPLFELHHVEESALASWVSEWNSWARPTWIAVTTMFQKGTTVEARLLQIGVALESLGYSLWRARDDGTDSTPSYPHLLREVTQAVNIEHPAAYGDLSPEAWRNGFNQAFKGTKHADKPLPDGPAALEFAKQGLNLIRLWLGTRLGVSDEVLRAGLDVR